MTSSTVTPAADNVELIRSQRASNRPCSGNRINPSPSRSTAKGATCLQAQASRNCFGTVNWPFSPILVVRYSRSGAAMSPAPLY